MSKRSGINSVLKHNFTGRREGRKEGRRREGRRREGGGRRGGGGGGALPVLAHA